MVVLLQLLNCRTFSAVSFKGTLDKCRMGTSLTRLNHPPHLVCPLLSLPQRWIIPLRRAIQNRNGGKKCDAPFSAEDVTWGGVCVCECEISQSYLDARAVSKGENVFSC